MRVLDVPAPRRVLVTTDAVGGVWRHALDLARALRERGVGTVLAGFGPPPDAAARREAEAVATLRWTGEPLDWMAAGPDDLARVPGTIADLAEAEGAGTVQVNLPSQAAGLPPGLRVVAVAHSCVASWFLTVRGAPPPAGWRWQQALVAEGLARADAVVAPTAAHAALLRRCYPGLGGVEVVPNAATPPGRLPEKRAVVHAAARWWDEGKDAATLDAAAALADWPVVAFGALAHPGVAPVRFAHACAAGPRPHAEVLEAAARAGVFVSTSVYEPFGLAALEAAARGAALVLSDIPTYRELWDGAALFAPPGDARGFAARMNRLARDPELRARLGARARSRAGTFTADRQARAMLRLLAAPSPSERETA